MRRTIIGERVARFDRQHRVEAACERAGLVLLALALVGIAALPFVIALAGR